MKRALAPGVFMLRERMTAYLDERLPVRAIRDAVGRILRRPLPAEPGFWRPVGFAAVFAVAVQFVTGVLLLCYYRPTASDAYASVQAIMTDVHFGWFIRKAHAWGATMVVALLALYLLRVFVSGTHRRPREFQWVTAASLLILALALGFTGYLLPWSQVSYWGTVVATESIGAAPVAGPPALQFLRGGEAVTELTLNRFFAAHVAVLPALLAGLLVLHGALMLWRHGAPVEAGGTPESAASRPLWPDHGLVVLSACFLTVGVWLTLVLLAPIHDTGPADPLSTPHGIKPEWYFLPIFQLTKIVPETAAFVLINAALALFLFWPFAESMLDRIAPSKTGRRRLALGIGFGALLVVLVLGVLGFLADGEFALLGSVYRFDTYGLPLSGTGGGG